VSLIEGAACIFTLLGWFICLFISASLGIPGVGVAPFESGFPRSFPSGIPGIGVVPLVSLLTFAGSGMPGVVFDDGATGAVESPSGKFFGSIFTLPFCLLAFPLGALAVWQAIPDKKAAHTKTNKTFFSIEFKKTSVILK
jgi:hypothetical protein